MTQPAHEKQRYNPVPLIVLISFIGCCALKGLGVGETSALFVVVSIPAGLFAIYILGRVFLAPFTRGRRY